MIRNKSILVILTLFAIAFAGYFWLKSHVSSSQEYLNNLSLFRHQRAEYFRNSEESPFVLKKVNFNYLTYYPGSLKFVIKAKFEPSHLQDTLQLATSTGSLDPYIIFGRANFTLNQKNQSLLILEEPGAHGKNLFIPFLDATSGNTTYGGGRYLEVAYVAGNNITLDFNRAYNPYCAYMEGYTCPFPPKQNRLTVAIEAGEKSFPDK